MKNFENLTIKEVQELHKEITYFANVISKKGENVKEQKETENDRIHSCPACKSTQLNFNGQSTHHGVNGMTYTTNMYYCPTCGFDHYT